MYIFPLDILTCNGLIHFGHCLLFWRKCNTAVQYSLIKHFMCLFIALRQENVCFLGSSISNDFRFLLTNALKCRLGFATMCSHIVWRRFVCFSFVRVSSSTAQFTNASPLTIVSEKRASKLLVAHSLEHLLSENRCMAHGKVHTMLVLCGRTESNSIVSLVAVVLGALWLVTFITPNNEQYSTHSS